jgi:hypothetical protein
MRTRRRTNWKVEFKVLMFLRFFFHTVPNRSIKATVRPTVMVASM